MHSEEINKTILLAVTPYKDSEKGKKQQVEAMFDNIAGKYDFLNHFFSLGIDKCWRKKLVRLLKKDNPRIVLDIACGTADLSISLLKLNPDKIIGVDISEEMLNIGRKKLINKHLDHKIELQKADSEKLPFDNNSFDAITVAFGVRNFENLEQGLSEIFRVLKSNGTLAILEFSKPDNFIIKHLFKFYFFWIMPFVGKIVSKDNSAYSYLPNSVDAFPNKTMFNEMLKQTEFKNTEHYSLSFGIATIFIAKKA